MEVLILPHRHLKMRFLSLLRPADLHIHYQFIHLPAVRHEIFKSIKGDSGIPSLLCWTACRGSNTGSAVTGTPLLEWICTNHPWEGQGPIPLSQVPSSEHPKKLPEICLTHKKKLGSSQGSYLGIFHGDVAALPSVKVHGEDFGETKGRGLCKALDLGRTDKEAKLEFEWSLGMLTRHWNTMQQDGDSTGDFHFRGVHNSHHAEGEEQSENRDGTRDFQAVSATKLAQLCLLAQCPAGNLQVAHPNCPWRFLICPSWQRNFVPLNATNRHKNATNKVYQGWINSWKPLQAHGGILWAGPGVGLNNPCGSLPVEDILGFYEPINKLRVGVSDFGCGLVSPCGKKAGIKLEMACFGSLAVPGVLSGGDQPSLLSEGRGRDTSRAFFSHILPSAHSPKWHLSALQVFMSLLTSPGCIYCAWLIEHNPGHGNVRGVQRSICIEAQSLLFCSVLLGTVGDRRITQLSAIKSKPCQLLLAIKALCNVQEESKAPVLSFSTCMEFFDWF